MAAFLASQLDFIFFFYGLAFILLGGVCLALHRLNRSDVPWVALGGFGFLHGATEWLDLLALIFGDSPSFVTIRLVVMSASFLFLLEFARLMALRLSIWMPGRWVYFLLALPIVVGALFGGLPVANALARYVLCLPAALATSLIFARQVAKEAGMQRGFAIAASMGFALYGLAAGAVVSPAPFWPADALNSQTFTHLTGIPIQLIRGLLACSIAFAIWSLWGQRLIQELPSVRYKRHLQQLYFLTLATVAIILGGGWVLTQYLGDIYKQDIEHQARGAIELLASRLTGETAAVEGMVRVLAGTPAIENLAQNGSIGDASAQRILDLHTEASGAAAGFILDSGGKTIASSAGRDRAFGGATFLPDVPVFFITTPSLATRTTSRVTLFALATRLPAQPC